MIFRVLQIPSRIKKAEELFNAGEYTLASEIVKTVLEKKKEYVPAKYMRAKILIYQKQYLLAISELNSILQIPDFTKHVDELQIQYHLAELYNLTKQWQKEIQSYKIILSYNPTDQTANQRVGLAYFKQKNYHDAREALLIALSYNPAITEAYLPVAVSCFQMADYDNAEVYFLRCMDRKDTGGEAAFYLGQIYHGKKDLDAAIKMYERAKKEKQFYTKCVYKIAEIHFKLENYSDAIDELESGLHSLKKRDEESIAYRYLLAECYELNNQISEALHHWEQIEQESPNFRNTQMKIEEYKEILADDTLKKMFTATLEEIHPVLSEIIAQLNYNIISKTTLSKSLIIYKAFNTKKINEPPVLICFDRSAKEISESQIQSFTQRIHDEKCKNGIFITTSHFSVKAKSSPGARQIEMMDKDALAKMLARTTGKVKKK